MMRTRHVATATGRALFLAVALVWASPAAPSATAGPVLNEKLVTPHFSVHYTTVSGSPDAISPAVAQIVGNNAEKALAAEEALFGFGPPPSGADGRVDISVYEFRLASAYGIAGALSPDADQSESYLLLRASKATDLAVIAHEMFHVLQNSVWVQAGRFLHEATAVWAQSRAFPDEGSSEGFDPSLPLDYDNGEVREDAGYQSWSFFEFLAERYGAHVVREVFDQARTLRVNRGASPIAAVSATLAARGAMLGPTFRDFALANVNGDYSLAELRDAGLGALSDTKPLPTGARTGRLPRRVVTIDHLATNYFPVAAGGGKRSGRCRKASLRLDVTGPKNDAYAGYGLGERKPRPIAMANGRGRLTLPSWSTCGGAELILALVNSSTSRDDRTFTVTATLTVR